ncbi:MAG TPA: GAF domain-containing protein [Bacillota bacterium]|nr:GAF domain-containing protein [Bacillota bacterium]
MFEVKQYSGQREKDYELVIRQLQALIEDDDDEISVLANVAALLNQFLDEINWVGFYLWKKDELVLGPFQGLPACTRIAYGKGVCGTSLKEEKTMLVPDVNKFPGHIACDAASQSEIVVPMFINGQRYGVLDVDSPVLERFDNVDQTYLEKFVEILIQHLEKILHD